jgi:hypothetical protein
MLQTAACGLRLRISTLHHKRAIIQIHWVCGLCPSSIILNNYETTFLGVVLFLSSSEWKETATLLDLLERANLTHWTPPSPHLKAQTDPVSETLCFLVI